MDQTTQALDRTTFGDLTAVADAVLYEGYLLYPYKPSSPKNRIRWQFGVLLPRRWAEARGLDDLGVAGSAESWWQQTECLVHGGDDASLRCRIRFLRPAADDSTRAGLREFEVEFAIADLRNGPQRIPLLAEDSPAAVVTVSSPDDAATGAASDRLHRVRLLIENTDSSVDPEVSRDLALRSSLVATQTLLLVTGGEFVSLLEPPEWAEEAAHRCVNVHTFPVLAGADGRADAMLSSPILLPDHPEVAPESLGDMHDAGEIDEILALRILTLTDAEKSEMARSDPRTAEILARTEAIPAEAFARLHGAIRSMRPVQRVGPGGDAGGGAGDGPAGGPPDGSPVAMTLESLAEEPEETLESIVVDGVPVRRGDRVRLRPRAHGTDPQDRFLLGRTAVVEKLLVDLEGGRHFAVTVENDPAAELNRWYGRFRYFLPEEVEPLTAAPDATRSPCDNRPTVEQLFRDYRGRPRT